MNGYVHRTRLLLVSLFMLTAVGGSAPAPPSDPDEGEAEMRERLEALGYVADVSSDPDPARTGVALQDEERASPGINVYCSVNTREIKFLDMDGKILHTIRMPDAGTGADCMLEPDGREGFIALVEPSLMRIDWNSKVAWTSRGKHHHDFAVAPNGEIHVLAARRGTVEHGGLTLPIVDQAIVVLGENGELVREVGFEPLFAGGIQPQRLTTMAANQHRQEHRRYFAASDVYHVNTIEILRRDSPLGRRGDWLVCLRSQNLIAVVDSKQEAVGWTFGPGVLDAPHHPSVIANGNLLVFDNGRDRGWSRIIEIDPASREIVWQYPKAPSADFFSKVRGSAQELSNGNVLITESTKGRVFEVTRDGEIVWDFWNPDQTDKGKRRQIYRMIRLEPRQLPQLGEAGRK